MIRYLESNDIHNIILDIITDGVDSNSYSSYKYIRYIEEQYPYIKISTICGRYYASDVTGDYNRTKNYYELLINGKGVSTPSIQRIIDLCYEKFPGKGPEYIIYGTSPNWSNDYKL